MRNIDPRTTRSITVDILFSRLTEPNEPQSLLCLSSFLFFPDHFFSRSSSSDECDIDGAGGRFEEKFVALITVGISMDPRDSLNTVRSDFSLFLYRYDVGVDRGSVQDEADSTGATKMTSRDLFWCAIRRLVV